LELLHEGTKIACFKVCFKLRSEIAPPRIRNYLDEALEPTTTNDDA